MKRLLWGTSISVMMGISSVSMAQEGTNLPIVAIDLYPYTGEQLRNFESEIDAIMKQYYSTTSAEESAMLAITKQTVEEKMQNTDISWPWFDYSYCRNRDYYEVMTTIEYKDDSRKNVKCDVIAGLVTDADAFQLVYLKIGSDVLMDEAAELLEDNWLEKPDSADSKVIDKVDLSVYEASELEELKKRVEEEIEQYHEPDSKTEEIVKELTKAAVEKYLAEIEGSVSWAWFAYDYTNEWGFYTMTTSADIKADGRESEEIVYSELYPFEGQYELVYLSMGEENILIDRRDMLPDNYPPNADETATALLEKDDSGNTVLELQKCLIRLGCLTSESATGYFGDLTATAVCAFQQKCGLEETGSVNAALLRMIQREAAKVPEPVEYIWVSAKDLYEAYSSNEVAADNAYKDKMLAITGEVESVKKNWFSTSVNLSCGMWSLYTVECKFDSSHEDEVAVIQAGQKITIYGSGDGCGFFTVYVEDCSFAP